MQLSSIPAKIAAIFAASAAPTSVNTIPLTQAGTTQPGQASFDVGFPAVTMQPAGSGGVNPYGQDFNGIMKAMTAVLQWKSAGATFSYDAAFSASIGGYPKYAKLQKLSTNGFWVSTVDNNTTNPETGGAGWVDEFSVLFSVNGYQKLPSGLIVQWGLSNQANTENVNVSTSFPISFPSSCLAVVLTDFSNTTNNAVVWAADTVGASSFSSHWARSGMTLVGTQRNANYIAIGR